MEALEREARSCVSFFKGVPPSTLYFGGGTPSLLSEQELAKIFSWIEAFYLQPYGRSLKDLREVTIEVNPDDVTLPLAQSWLHLGVTRVSMGIQSFRDPALRWMGRRHDAQQARCAYQTLRQAGFQNISLDLIFGYSLEQDQDPIGGWEFDLEQMIALSPEHISAYQLSVEPGSTLAKWMQSGRAKELPAEVAAEEYALLQQRLKQAGYEQYEISNFAKSGYEALHNRSYWLREPYLGLGPAAHSFDGFIRSWNPEDLTHYQSHSGRVSEELTSEEVFNEQWMLGLRQVAGVRLADLDPALLNRVAGPLHRLLRQGLLIQTSDGYIKIPSEKLFVSDGIICELMLD